MPFNASSAPPPQQRRPTPNAAKAAAAAGPCRAAKDPNAFKAKADPSAQAKDAAEARVIASNRGRAQAKQFGDRANPRSEAAIRERVRAEMRAEQAASKERALKEWQAEVAQHGSNALDGSALGAAPAPPQGAPGIACLLKTAQEAKGGPLGAQLLPRLLEPATSTPLRSSAGGQASEARGAGSAAAGGGPVAARGGAAGD